MAKDSTLPIAELLVVAASTVVPVPDRQPWNEAWHLESYRKSKSAALRSSRGPVTMTSQGVAAFEDAVTELLKDSKIRGRWQAEEFWGLVAGTGVVAASELVGEERLEYLKERISYWKNVAEALTIQLVANITWEHPPLLLGAAVIGNTNDEFFAFVNASAQGRTQITQNLSEVWMKLEVEPRQINNSPTPVAIACWTAGQLLKAFDETGRQLRNVVDLALLLDRDLAAHKAYGRDDTNRPGIRGVTLDRGAIERNLARPATMELATEQLTINEEGNSKRGHWRSAEPLPLGSLLNQDYLRKAVQSCLRDDPISNRIRIAARWFAEARYTLAADDAALALGVGMDALLTGKNNLPGGAMADRVAMLEPDPAKRHERATNYLEFYKVRSSVAHGGRSSKLNDPDFIDEYGAFVHWAAWRSIALRDRFTISSEGAVDDLYNELRWGVQSWAT